MTNNEGIPELAFDAVNVSDPGAIPYIEFSANNFGEIMTKFQQLSIIILYRLLNCFIILKILFVTELIRPLTFSHCP